MGMDHVTSATLVFLLGYYLLGCASAHAQRVARALAQGASETDRRAAAG